jgi:hypothetical protein
MANLESLMDGELWTRVVYVVAGFLVATLLQNVVESRSTDLSIPGEVYGLPVVAFAATRDDDVMYAAFGGGVHVMKELGSRFNAMDTVNEIGA